MAFDLQGFRKQMSTWIRPMVLCFACGIGLGLALVFANGTIHYLQTRPKAWDRKSIRATLVDAVPISEIDLSAGIVPEPSPSVNPPQSLPANFRGFDEDKQPTTRKVNKSSDPYALIAQPIQLQASDIEEQHSGVSFSVDLQNTTSADVTIPKTVIIMQATRGTHTLHSSLLWLAGDYFIPAGHSVSAILENSGFCQAGEDPHQCFDDHF